MTDPTVAAMREVAGFSLYGRNAFRLAGVSVHAGRRDVRHRRQKVVTLLEVGAEAGLAGDPQEVAAAFDLILGDPRRRLVHELFWMWHDPAATCCPPALHQDHDRAIRAHREALAGDGDLDLLWQKAGKHWDRLIRRALFWEHVRKRIEALDDRQLDETVIDTLRAELPVTLVRPLVQLAAQDGPQQAELGRLARAWPRTGDFVAAELERAAEPLYQEIRDQLNALTDGLEARGDAPLTARRVRKQVVPKLDRLARLIPESRSTARLRNSAATLLNNCAVKLIDGIGANANPDARRWLDTARTLASEPDTVDKIAQNREALDLIVAMSGHRRAAPARRPSPPAGERRGVLTRVLVWLLICGSLIWGVTRCASDDDAQGARPAAVIRR